MNNYGNKEKKITLRVKVYKSRLPQWWNTQCMGPDKVPKNLQGDLIGFRSRYLAL